MKLEIGRSVDRYVIERALGAGGTAMVYLVRHHHLGTRHALKVLTLSSSAIRERMLREGQVQATLDHPNIVAVTDVLDIDGAPGLLMECIEGPSLERALGQYRLTMGDAETLFLGIVSGVKAAHAKGLVHRDLKPANVLLSKGSAGFIPKVTDFGLAKVLESAPSVMSTRSGIAMGTPSYMAPEQIRDARTVDQRADLWSLGCLLYELMTRHRAFPGDETLAIYNAVTSGTFIPPRQLVPDLPVRIEQAIHGLLRVDKDRRIPDCVTLQEVLRGERAWPLPAGIPSSPVAGVVRGGAMSLDAPEMHVLKGASTPAPRSRERRPPARRGGGVGPGAEPALSSALGSGVPPLIDPHAADEMETVVLPMRAIDGSLAPDSMGGEEVGLGWVGWLFLGVFGVVVGGLVLLAFAGVLGSVMYSERVGGGGESVAPAPRPDPVPVVRPEPEPEPEPEQASPEPTDPEPKKKPKPRVKPRVKPRPKPAPVVVPDPTRDVPDPGLSSPEPEPAGAVIAKVLSVPPVATLFVDGREVGRTPNKLELVPGRHALILRSGGQDGSFMIDVQPGAENKWCYSFASQKDYKGACR